ncbi:class I SAM-dependent methyltransferase [Variovorax boronicumulans]|uniref:class I SAM-dependent methyltransferase n=1 Tax=Variovorax boronicumulans TaxID=436515 RepID=UPI00214BC9AB
MACGPRQILGPIHRPAAAQGLLRRRHHGARDDGKRARRAPLKSPSLRSTAGWCPTGSRGGCRTAATSSAADRGDQFDRIVSLEMLEAAGRRHWPACFDAVRWRLSADGVAGAQVTTIADAHVDHRRRTPDSIQRFIVAGGMQPSVEAMRAQALRAECTLAQNEAMPSTWAEWRHRFLAAGPAFKRRVSTPPSRRSGHAACAAAKRASCRDGSAAACSR